MRISQPAGIRIFLLILGTATCCGAQPLPGIFEQPAAEAELNRPVLKMSLTDACTIRIEDGRLVVDTPLRRVRLVDQPVEIAGLAGISRLTLRPGVLEFHNIGPAARGRPSRLSIRVSTNRNHTVDIERFDGERSVQYSDQRMYYSNGVRLSVYSSLGYLVHSVQADDFASLCREHPADVYRYLGPLLRLFNTEGVFAFNPRLARWVLPPRRPVEQVAPMVLGLLGQLESPQLEVRQQAFERLAALGNDAVEPLRALDRRALSPEQQVKVDALLHEYEGLTQEQVQTLRQDPGFLLDCLYGAPVELRRWAAEYLAALLGESICFDPDSDPLEQAPIVEALRRRLVRTDAASTDRRPQQVSMR